MEHQIIKFEVDEEKRIIYGRGRGHLDEDIFEFSYIDFFVQGIMVAGCGAGCDHFPEYGIWFPLRKEVVLFFVKMYRGMGTMVRHYVF